MTGATGRALYSDEQLAFRESAATFAAREILPRAAELDLETVTPPQLRRQAVELGFAGARRPEQLGGMGLDDLRFSAVLAEQLVGAGAVGLWLAFAVHSDLSLRVLLESDVAPHDDWIAERIASDELIAFASPAMVGEPGGVAAARTSMGWTLDGSCAAVVSGCDASLLVVHATATSGAPVVLAVDAASRGVARGPATRATGLGASGIAGVAFNGVSVDDSRMVADEAAAAGVLTRALDDFRLLLAAAFVAGADAAFAATVEYVTDRRAFGRPIASFENTALQLGEVAAQLELVRPYVQQQLGDAAEHRVSSTGAEVARSRASDAYCHATDVGLQLHGGYGYMLEYPLARAYSAAQALREFAAHPAALAPLVRA